jgi:2-polyprenyl-3-methyl-5-hydroxy-6-metoxy-1,4-benzoquinol methylase
MTNSIKPAGYETKPTQYFGQLRTEMLPFVPADCRKLLDVGCGSGSFGAELKRRRKVEVWGIEPVTHAAKIAATNLDHVVEGIFAPEAGLPTSAFDAVIFNDVLEHLFDPVAALEYAKTLLSRRGVVVASIPNIRHFPSQWQVLVRGEWQYADYGIFDRTHLKFYTKKSIMALFAESGFQVQTITGINTYFSGTPRKWLCYRLLNLATFGAVSDMKYLQFAVVAKPL